MPLDISLDQFRSISDGKYNAGQIDVTVKKDGTATLKKVNAHVHLTSLNTATIDPAQTLEIKQSFVRAIAPHVNEEDAARIREDLGLPATEGGTVRSGHAYEPLTRQQVRTILDAYVPPEVRKARAEDAKRTSVRASVNAANLSAQPIRVGDQALKIDQIGTDKIGFQGFKDSTRLARAEEGMQFAAEDIVGILRRPDGGRADLTTLARKLNTLALFAERAAALNPNGGDVGTRVNAAIARALDQVDNGALALVFQGTMSREVDGLKTEISRRMADPSTLPSQYEACERLLEGLSRLEARVVSEVSYRVGLGKTPAEERAAIQSPVQRWCGVTPTAHGGASEMSTSNLEILARRTDAELRGADVKLDGVDARMRSHGFTAVDSRKIGDMIRSNELTLNIFLPNLLGWRDGKAPALGDAGFVFRNTFASKEAQRLAMDGTGYLVKRNEVEKYFFPEYSGPTIKGGERPLYAAFNPMKMLAGGASSYGGTVVVLKQHVKQQATYTLNDTFFTLNLSTTSDSRQRFVTELARALDGKVSQQTIASLTTPGNALYDAIDGFYALYDGKDVSAQGALLSVCYQLANLLAPLQTGEGRKLDKDDINALMIRTTGVQVDVSSLSATYDNIETLLDKSADFMAVGFGVSTLRRAADPAAPIKMIGCDYIEAQLHAPIVLGRDVEEIRIPISEIRSHFSAEYRNLKEKPAGTREDWIAQKVEQQKNDILALSRQSGVKITFYGATDPNEDISRQNQSEDIATMRSFMKESSLKVAKDILDGDMTAVYSECGKTLSQDRKAAFFAEFGDDLSRMPTWVKDLLHTEAERTLKVFDDPKSDNVYDEATTEVFLRRKVTDAMVKLSAALVAMDKHGVTNPTVRADLLRGFARMNMPEHKADAFVAAKIAIMRVSESPRSVVDAVMSGEFPTHIRTELSELGAKDGLPLSGVGLSNLTKAVVDFLAKKATSGAVVSVDDLIAEVQQKVVKPALVTRIDLLRSIANWEFRSDDDRRSFVEWAVNSGKLKTLEELKGVYAASGMLSDGFAAALEKLPLDSKGMMKIFREFFDVARSYAELDMRNHSEFGPDDRNAVVFRAVNVALSRLYLRVGQEGMDKLGQMMSSEAVRDLYAAAQTMAGNTSSLKNWADTVPISLLNTFLHSTGARLSEKYGQHCKLDSVAPMPFKNVPPEMRNLIAPLAPAIVGALSEKTPYEPVFRAIPAPVNPAGLPSDLAGRKSFLRAALPTYHQHEKTFENGRNTHGRTHATRAFVLANVLGNILSERGVPVDMNALCLGIAGHDMGRKGSGEDKWERESGDLTTKMGERLTSGAGGPAWCGAVKANIAGKAPELDAQRTIEGYLLKAADSLDYTRVRKIDPTHFHFMETSFSCGGGVVQPDAALRDELIREAAELTRLTDPYTLRSDELTNLENEINKFQGGRTKEDREQFDAKWKEYSDLKTEVSTAEINQTNQLTDEQIIDLVEQTIRANPDKFPLLNQYYR